MDGINFIVSRETFKILVFNIILGTNKDKKENWKASRIASACSVRTCGVCDLQ